jgi:predicted RNase H-like nuclease (RuvC/YqgF family)
MIKLFNQGKRTFTIGQDKAGNDIQILPNRFKDIDDKLANKLKSRYPKELINAEDYTDLKATKNTVKENKNLQKINKTLKQENEELKKKLEVLDDETDLEKDLEDDLEDLDKEDDK